MYSITLVIIGRNDESKLRNIYTNEYVKTIKNHFEEIIYVDSNSTDGSVGFCKSIGFKVYSIDKHSFCSASAGRYIGAKCTKSEYILFLDSDMKLAGSSVERMSTEIDKAVSYDYCGIVGEVNDVYENGKSRVRIRKDLGDHKAISFGGFVLLKKASLMDAGNWNPFVPANEELELQARLKKRGFHIYRSSLLEVYHYTAKSSALNELLGVYYPLNKSRYGSLGYALNSSIKNDSFLMLLSLIPETVAAFILMFSCVISVMTGMYVISFLGCAIYMAIVLKRRSWKFLVVPPGNVLSAIYGYWKYREGDISFYES
jgi:glycosyltransferase involved in cell wall biosynthesis